MKEAPAPVADEAAAAGDKRKAKELSAFARNGFSFDIGRRVFDMSFEDAEEVILAGRR